EGNELPGRPTTYSAERFLFGFSVAYQVGQCHSIDCMSYSVTYLRPEQFDAARIEKAADLRHFAFCRADHRSNRAFQHTQDFAHRDFCWISAQFIAAM